MSVQSRPKTVSGFDGEGDRFARIQTAGIVLTTGVFWLLGGVVGIGLAVGLGLALYRLPGVFVFALGQLALAVLLPEPTTLGTLLLVESPLLLLLAIPFDDIATTAREDGISFVLAGIVVTGTTGAAVMMSRLWLAVVVVVGGVVTIGYGLHRYSLVLFGVIDYE